MSKKQPLVAPGRMRLRDLGVKIGRYSPGPWNAITDVEGVRVGHVTLIKDVKEGRPIRTGVTAVIPGEEIFPNPLLAGSFVLNGAGEMSGLIQVQEWGQVETPIILTNTFSVGICSSAVARDMMRRYPEIGKTSDVVIPLVGECDDSWLNDIGGMHIHAEDVYSALARAASGPVPEGNVGGGTGMITCDFKAGIGTSSRMLQGELARHKVGILVMSNFGVREELRVDGFPLGRIIAPQFAGYKRRTKSYGSIIAVLATDVPLTTHQLNRVSKRVALGIGRVGSHAAHGSGEIVMAFSTANRIPRSAKSTYFTLQALQDSSINQIYQAAIEATEEAILNSLCAAEEMSGVEGNLAPALPLDQVKKYCLETPE